MTVKYNDNQEGVPVSPKIVLEVIENDKKKRRIEIDEFCSPDNTAFF